MKARLEDLMDRAAEAGFENANALSRLTPREAVRAFRAFEAEKRRELELADALAWLIGRYVAIALNAPERYPSRPDGICNPPREMTEAEMKCAFRKFLKEETI